MTATSDTKRPAGMVGFTIVWAYDISGSATVMGVVQTSYILPFLLISPIAGAMVDRYNRKLMMMGCFSVPRQPPKAGDCILNELYAVGCVG